MSYSDADTADKAYSLRQNGILTDCKIVGANSKDGAREWDVHRLVFATHSDLFLMECEEVGSMRWFCYCCF